MPLARGLISLNEFGLGILHARSLEIENERLRSQLISLGAYQETVEYQKQQIEQLRSELGFPPHNRKPINLNVIGISQVDGSLFLDGGSELGIRPDLPVINGDGIVGIVQSVTRGECHVALLTAYGVKLGGVDSSRKPPEGGLVSGIGSSTLTMLTFQSKAPVSSGDLIMTGGQSQNIPGGLVIGHVISVVDDQIYGTRRLTIDPAVNIGLLHEVQVLK